MTSRQQCEEKRDGVDALVRDWLSQMETGPAAQAGLIDELGIEGAVDELLGQMGHDIADRGDLIEAMRAVRASFDDEMQEQGEEGEGTKSSGNADLDAAAAALQSGAFTATDEEALYRAAIDLQRRSMMDDWNEIDGEDLDELEAIVAEHGDKIPRVADVAETIRQNVNAMDGAGTGGSGNVRAYTRADGTRVRSYSRGKSDEEATDKPVGARFLYA